MNGIQLAGLFAGKPCSYNFVSISGFVDDSEL
ncbi:hypothetical protein [Pseudomonas sp. FEN]|nr:hypothetical protein [Pseudomonas sp. FEN]